ncbi:VOC family protein [Actinomadura alba]|uniref:VOC family protein n=1 Tax=Actinomadura alba TaxID=406431 RepID=A0ABR7LLU4_9ACTN|nr:VOC family protein [Actinomadura alba]MBC6465731.1 VOC family protein [Actinomadura alba]
MAAPALFSIVLGSPDPERLYAWYRSALAPEDTGDEHIDFGGVWLRIEHRTDVADGNPEPGRTILNFLVEDARALAEHLDAMGVSWLAEVHEREHALLGTLTDPDGNLLQIVQLDKEAYLTSLAP